MRGRCGTGAMRLLIVEDDPKMARLIRRGLREEGAVVDVAGRGEDAVWMASSTEYDALVLDVMLPGIDGFEVCRRLRADDVWTPVLLLTARDAVEDRIAGLDGGADDYLTKPFSFGELVARLRALVRRGQVERPTVVEVGDLRLDPATRRVWRGRQEIELSPREFALLEGFMRRPGEALSRLQLLERAWDYAYDNRSNVVDVYVRYLRGKIDRPFGVTSIETVRGHGYRLREDGGGLTRLSLRLRLTLGFALVMAVLLALTGIVVYRIFRSDLNATIDRSLSSRSAAIAALVHQSDDVPALGPVAAVDDFAQVLGPDGTLAASTPNARTRALLTRRGAAAGRPGARPRRPRAGRRARRPGARAGRARADDPRAPGRRGRDRARAARRLAADARRAARGRGDRGARAGLGRGLGRRRLRAAAGRGDAPPGGGHLAREVRRAPARRAVRRRDRPARRDAQRDARPAPGRLRPRAAVHGRRQP